MTTRTEQIQFQRDTLHALLTREWQTTRVLADQTPWSVRTIIQDLRALERSGLAESRGGRGSSRTWVSWRLPDQNS